jgi:L-histidine N-alpha-methyltransferase
MADDVRRGLQSNPRTLPAKYFYDDRGSQLFEQITTLPEYYQTRTEASILQGLAPRLITEHGFGELVELGSGAAIKTRRLLDAMEQRGTLRRYIPIDVSEFMLRESAAVLLDRYRGLRVHAVAGDFLQHLEKLPDRDGTRLVIFLGSTIGNLDVDERQRFLDDVREILGQGDAFLLGVDLVKDIRRIEAAYNDSEGVTAEFNLNVLRVINRELDADFDLEAFRHLSFYNVEDARIEMHLVATTARTARVGALGLAFPFGPGDTIRTEISCKFTRESLEAILGRSRLALKSWYTDPDSLFGLALATRE